LIMWIMRPAHQEQMAALMYQEHIYLMQVISLWQEIISDKQSLIYSHLKKPFLSWTLTEAVLTLT